MLLEKMGLLLFINYFNQLEKVKRHLTSSLRELLLAFSATLEIVQHTTGHHFLLGRMDSLSLTFKKIDTLIRLSVEQLGSPEVAREQRDTRQLKEHILESIITVIDEEIDNLETQPDARSQLKVEALNTVKRVLRNHVEESDYQAIEDEVVEIPIRSTRKKA